MIDSIVINSHLAINETKSYGSLQLLEINCCFWHCQKQSSFHNRQYNMYTYNVIHRENKDMGHSIDTSNTGWGIKSDNDG